MEIGNKIGSWTILDIAPSRNRKKYWKVLCDCGTEAEVADYSLKKGQSNSCRKCCNNIRYRNSRNLPEIGDTYFDWTVVETVENQHGSTLIKLRCKCGYEATKELGVHYSSKRCRNCYGDLQRGIPKEHSRKGYKSLSSTYWTALQAGAAQRNLAFTISIEEAWKLFEAQESLCALSGIPIEITYSLSEGEQTASLDRIDSTKGYEINNVQWVHKTINYMKWTLSQEEFIELCHAVTNHNKCG